MWFQCILNLVKDFFCLFIFFLITLTVPFSFLCTYVPAPVDHFNSSQVRATAIIEATGNCTLEVSPLPQINNTTSTVHKLFIYSQAKYYNFLRKQGVIWPFNIIKI
jgi:hypothetical protein